MRIGVFLAVMIAAIAVVIATMAIGIRDEPRSPRDTVRVTSAAAPAPPDLSGALRGGGSTVAPAAGVDGRLRPTLFGGRVQSYTVTLASDDPAGLKDGDTILSVGNQPLSDFATAARVSDLVKIGDDVVLRRAGREMRFAYGYPDG